MSEERTIIRTLRTIRVAKSSGPKFNGLYTNKLCDFRGIKPDSSLVPYQPFDFNFSIIYVH